jgi:hypothetical protein
LAEDETLPHAQTGGPYIFVDHSSPSGDPFNIRAYNIKRVVIRIEKTQVQF